MKILATVTKGKFQAGMEYDLPEKEAQAAIMAGYAEPLVTESQANDREKAVKPQHQTRWRTR
jgi:hypothetical protein